MTILNIGMRLLAVAAAGLCALAAARADQILLTHNGSLTTYKPTSMSGGQKVRPLALQRGVNLDGSMRAAGGFAWALTANPFENGQAGETLAGINGVTATYSPTEVDLTFPALVPWTVGRTYNARQELSSSHHTSNGYQGKNWFQLSQPEIVLYDADSNSVTKEDDDLVYLVYGADRYVEFVRTADNANTFRGVNGAAGIFQFVSGSPDTYVYYDPSGNRTYFFGFNTSGSVANGQIWKMVDPAGNSAFAGDASTASTAVSNGFNANGAITQAYDSSGRRYCYEYSGSAIGGAKRLIQVTVETNAGGGWDECGSETLVGKVEYDYYESSDTTYGSAGNLKLVTVTTPQSDPAVMLQRRQYYRYWTTESAAPDTVQMVIGNEGVRRFDWEADSDFDGDYLTALESSLLPYSDIYLTYDSSYRVLSVFTNGECGCGGGGAVDGTYTFSGYGTSNPLFSDNPTGYDQEWKYRVVVQPPTGGAWMTQYYDETGQALSRVRSDIDPASASNFWATKVVRNSDGQTVEVHTPANATAYTHNSGVNASGAITSGGSAGLVYYYMRETTGDLTGFTTGVRQQAGETSLTSTSAFLSWTQYTSRSLSITGGVNVTRPLIDLTRQYHTETTTASTSGTYDQSDMDYAWWDNTTSTDIAYFTLQQIISKAPSVSMSKNGSGSPTATTRYLRKDGTTAFGMSARGIVTYSRYTNGQLVERIEDADTDTGTTYPSGEHPYTDFGIAPSALGMHRITTFSYDAQGRADETTLPDGRITKKVYAALASQRPARFNAPRVVHGISTTYYGPVGYAVFNQAGGLEQCMVVAVDTPTTESPSDWIRVVQLLAPIDLDDPLEAFVTGLSAVDRRIVRLIHSEFNETGQRLSMQAVAFDIPSSLASLDYEGAGQNADASYAKYDDMGRKVRTKDITGTISRINYDALSRVTSRQTGTNDADEVGTDDMVTTEAMVYDGGSAGGNSHLTQRTWYVVDSTTDQRVSTYVYDYRGRLLVKNGPLPPHAVMQYDNRGRVVAAGLYTSTQTSSTVPTSTTTDRVAMSQTFYDERGQVYKAQQHKINQSTGVDEDTLETLSWYDPDGQPIKSDGSQLTKTRYDRLGRTVQTFVLANDNDAANTYTDVYDTTKLSAKLAGDKVLEERQTGYDVDDTVLVQAMISRKHDDTSTTGPLDITNDSGDDDPLQFTGTDVKGRIQIAAVWYDEIDRPTTRAFYGTNSTTGNVATFDRDGLSAPSTSSPSVMVTKVAHNPDNTVRETSDPNNKVMGYEYDDAGRRTATIANKTGGSTSTAVRDTDIYTRYTYSKGLETEMWIDINADGTQDPEDLVTTYVYGTAKGTAGSGSPVQSAIGTGSLLREVIHPEQSSGQSAADRTIAYAYNAQGEQVWTRDQEGNVIETNRDSLGRETDRRVTTLDSDFDGKVLRISTAYLSRGLVDTVTQYNNATVGSGTIQDQVQFLYDGWGNMTTFKQDVDSGIGGSGRASFQVDNGYVKATGGRNTLRRSSVSLPGTTAVSLDYLSSGSKLDADASRVSQVNVSINLGSAVTVAKYEYLGSSQLAGADLPQPSARWNWYEGGSSGDPYPDLDQFNRVTDSRWTGYKTSGTRQFYDVHINYDDASNITSIVDNVMKAGVSGNHNFDAKYTLDGVYRLTRVQEGTLSSGSIINQSRDEQWQKANGDPGLSQTNDWLSHLVNLNNDSDYVDAGEINDTSTFSLANELKTRDTDSNGTANYTITSDKDGNMTSDGQNYTYMYDAFGRVREVKKIGSNTVAEYTYNGLGFRIGWHYDANGSNAVDSSDPWYYWCYDQSWRQVATFRGSDSDPKEVFVHHLAGLDGQGFSSYIDNVILRDRDANTGWTSAADSTREERRYYCQNWRSDVSAILTSDGKMVEWIKYSAYGVPYALPAGDTDSDGDWDATDSGNITVAFTYNVRLDTNLDGSINASDVTHANSITGGYQTLGRGKVSSTAVASRRAYAGYEYDPTFNGAGRHLYHVRNRVYDAEVGRWTRRDPYTQHAINLYDYVFLSPLRFSDPLGLHAVCAGGEKTCDELLAECMKDDEVKRIKKAAEEACQKYIPTRTIEGPKCCESTSEDCGDDKPETVGQTDRDKDKITVCVCMKKGTKLPKGPGDLKTVCSTIKHELSHAWQKCNMGHPAGKVDWDERIPSDAWDDLFNMCDEIGAECGSKGGDCDIDSICKWYCKNYSPAWKVLKKSECDAKCKAAFEKCREWWPKPAVPAKEQEKPKKGNDIKVGCR